MSTVNGTNNDDTLAGNAQGQADTIKGGRGDDTLSGYSGDDLLIGGRGNDVLIGGAGSDVMEGGLDSDTFRFSAGHLTQDSIDWITDFSFNQNDSLQFLASGGAWGAISIVSAEARFVTNQSASGYDLSNSANGRELILEVKNAAGVSQKIVLIDCFSSANAAQWQTYLHDQLGFQGTIDASTASVTLGDTLVI